MELLITHAKECGYAFSGETRAFIEREMRYAPVTQDLSD